MTELHGLAPPFATGGGGGAFEVEVHAMFLALFLARGHAPGLPGWPIVKLRFQGRADGNATDDVNVYAEDPNSGRQARLLAQIKHRVTVGENEVFRKTIREAWHDFSSDSFRRGVDRIVLIGGPLSSADAGDVRELLHWARTRGAAAEFVADVERHRYGSKTKVQKLAAFRSAVELARGEEPSDEELFAFLRHYDVLGFDVDFPGGGHEALLRTILARFAPADPDGLLAKLVREVTKLNLAGGTVSDDGAPTLPLELLETFDRRVDSLATSARRSATDWSPGELGYEFAVATLLGAWRDDVPGDADAVEGATGLELGAWTNRIRPLLDSQGTPLLVSGTYWSVSETQRTWAQIAPYLTDKDLDRFLEVAVAVLSEPDPKVGMSTSERWAAVIRGNTFSWSEELRTGIAHGLALLGTGEQVPARTSLRKGQQTAFRAVRRLLMDAKTEQWLSLGSLLPVLAEASPDAFLDALENALDEPGWVTNRTDAPDDALHRAPPLLGLVSALETLAWEPDYLARSAVLLAELAGHWHSSATNKALDALVHVFLPWHPQTHADVERRTGALRALADEATNVAVKLLPRLLPDHHQVAFPGRRPRWRNPPPDGWQPGITRGEYEAACTEVASLLLDIGEKEPSVLPKLAAHVDRLPVSVRERFLGHLSCVAAQSLSDGERASVWEQLIKVVGNHRRFASAKWALGSDVVDQIEKAAAAVKPEEPELEYRRVFEERAIDLLDDVPTAELWQHKLDLQTEAVEALLAAGGVEGVLDFASSVSSPHEVGVALGVVGTSDTDNAILPRFLLDGRPKVRSLAAGYVTGRLRVSGWEWVEEAKSFCRSEAELRQLLCDLPFVPEAWLRVSEWLSDESDYWSNVAVRPHAPDDQLEFAVDQLLSVARYAEAIDCLYRLTHVENEVDAVRTPQALLGLVNSPPGARRPGTHELSELIRGLQDAPGVDPGLMFQIEWAYAALLDGHHGVSPTVLEERLALDPAWFCELIRYIYRSEYDSGDAEPPGAEQQAVAQNGWRVLQRWRRVPGTLADDTFDQGEFATWLAAVRDSCAESGHLAVALQTAGRVLIHAPADPAGLWIHATVAGALNARDAKELRAGYRMGWHNSRGVRMVDPTGRPERELAASFEERAAAVETAGYHRLAGTLRDLARGYDAEAERIVAQHGSNEEDVF